jgi:hypothetical protein
MTFQLTPRKPSDVTQHRDAGVWQRLMHLSNGAGIDLDQHNVTPRSTPAAPPPE